MSTDRDTERKLCDEYEAYTSKHGLPFRSADELLHELICSRRDDQAPDPGLEAHITWLIGFLARWEAWEKAERERFRKANLLRVIAILETDISAQTADEEASRVSRLQVAREEYGPEDEALVHAIRRRQEEVARAQRDAEYGNG